MKPPRIAEWLLTNAAPGPLTDALAGDLAEEFSRRQSCAWYWRQVFIAITAALRPYLAVIPLWSAGVYYSTPAVFSLLLPIERRIAWGPQYSLPALMLVFIAITVATYTAIAAAGLALALALMHNLRRQPFLSGLLWTTLIMIVGDLAFLYRPRVSHLPSTYTITTVLALVVSLRLSTHKGIHA